MGRRRKKRKPVRRVVRRIPKVFQCPRCGQMNVTIELNRIDAANSRATIRCGSCELRAELIVPSIFQPVDVYGKFIDYYHSGELEYEVGEEEEAV